jgi:hypothetical protein
MSVQLGSDSQILALFIGEKIPEFSRYIQHQGGGIRRFGYFLFYGNGEKIHVYKDG